MPFSATLHHGLPYLLARAEGHARLADLCGLADMVGTVAARQGYRRAVVDMLPLELDLSFTDHLTLGAHVAQAFAQLERVASVIEVRNRVGTSEKAAQRLGLRLRAFTDLDEAIRWLTTD